MFKHSVEFNNTNLSTSLLIFKDLSDNFAHFFNNSDIFIHEPFTKEQSDADAIIEAPLENFEELFKIKFTSVNVQADNVFYYVDHTQWNNNKIAQGPLLFSNSIVYSGIINLFSDIILNINLYVFLKYFISLARFFSI